MSDIHFGGCSCGALRYRVTGTPTVSTVCHCKFCQRRPASAFAVVVAFPEAAFEVTRQAAPLPNQAPG